MTPLHWLAFWGDYRAMFLALNRIKPHLEADTNLFIDENKYF